MKAYVIVLSERGSFNDVDHSPQKLTKSAERFEDTARYSKDGLFPSCVVRARQVRGGVQQTSSVENLTRRRRHYEVLIPRNHNLK